MSCFVEVSIDSVGSDGGESGGSRRTALPERRKTLRRLGDPHLVPNRASGAGGPKRTQTRSLPAGTGGFTFPLDVLIKDSIT